MEFIKPRKEKFVDQDDSSKWRFGMQNFMLPDSEDYERVQKLARENKVIDDWKYFSIDNGYPKDWKIKLVDVKLK